MTKRRRAKRRAAASRPTARRKRKKAVRRTRRTADYGSSAWTIRFRTERELRERLDALLALFDDEAAAVGLETTAEGESCLSLIQAVQIVARALAPKAFVPTEKLGDTYLTAQERELFRNRAVRGVTSAGCTISDGDVPSGEGTTHSAVAGAIRDNAHA